MTVSNLTGLERQKIIYAEHISGPSPVLLEHLWIFMKAQRPLPHIEFWPWKELPGQCNQTLHFMDVVTEAHSCWALAGGHTADSYSLLEQPSSTALLCCCCCYSWPQTPHYSTYPQGREQGGREKERERERRWGGGREQIPLTSACDLLINKSAFLKGIQT